MERLEAGAIKILTVVGARANFMKAAPIIAAINAHNERLVTGYAGRPESRVETIRHILVHTGQHYDEVMSGSFFNDLNLPKPDIHLGTGSGSHATQTPEIMKKFEEVLLGEKPDTVVVVGDVNSTLACALVTSKISFDSDGSRSVIAHVEAGLRSFDRSMERNPASTWAITDLEPSESKEILEVTKAQASVELTSPTTTTVSGFSPSNTSSNFFIISGVWVACEPEPVPR